MYVHTITAIIVSLAAATTTLCIPLSQRIVGGTPVKEGELPYFVQFKGCGGTLIGLQTIVTAGHCLRSTPDDKAYLGGINFKPLKPVKVVVHPKFARATLVNDIGLEFLPEKVDGPYALIEGTSYPEEGSKLMVAGYGRTSTDGPRSQILLKVHVNVGNETDCTEHYNDGRRFFDPVTQVCGTAIPGFSDCSGDSGGPLYISSGNNMHVVGLVSGYGHVLACGEKGAYSYYTFIKPYIPWIKSEVEKFEKDGAEADSATV
ncbi:hypothetical protein BGZ68_008557 [Mortierella alpina]|nr:hypothetical protein BGZ68_008557 [Mortierella alpina]